MSITLVLFLIVVGITLVITAWAARRTRTTVQFWAAGRTIKGWQNGLAIAGDYMSAASFLGIAGLIAFNGYDGFMYSVGWLVAYLTVLFLIAEPMRNTGKYTMADVLSYRMSPVPVRSAAAFSTIAVSASYMMAQMIGAGSLIKILLPDLDKNLSPYFNWALFGTKLDPSIALVGALMMIYVIAGGMVATTWVQIVKAVLLMGGAILLSLLVLLYFNFNFLAFFDKIYSVKDKATGLPFTSPGILYPYGKATVWGIDKALVENVSLGLALILGTAGLPHILMRFFTVPNAKAARSSVAFSHDFYVNVVRTHLFHGTVSEREQVLVARITAALVGLLSIWLAAKTGATANVAALVAGVAFVIAASANLPAILFTLFWKRFNTWGAVSSLVGGTVVTIWLVAAGPGWTLPAVAHPAFPLQNVGIVAIPVGFVLAIVGTYVGELFKADRLAELRFHEIDVRAQTGVGAEASPMPA